MKRRNFSSRRKYWERTITKGQSSGLPVKEFCRRRGIALWSYYHWSKKLKRPGRPKSVAELVPIEVRAESPGVSIRLVLKSGWALEFGQSPSVEWLAALVRLIT